MAKHRLVLQDLHYTNRVCGIHPGSSSTLTITQLRDGEPWKQVELELGDYALMCLRDELIGLCKQRASSLNRHIEQLTEGIASE